MRSLAQWVYKAATRLADSLEPKIHWKGTLLLWFTYLLRFLGIGTANFGDIGVALGAGIAIFIATGIWKE